MTGGAPIWASQPHGCLRTSPGVTVQGGGSGLGFSGSVTPSECQSLGSLGPFGDVLLKPSPLAWGCEWP